MKIQNKLPAIVNGQIKTLPLVHGPGLLVYFFTEDGFHYRVSGNHEYITTGDSTNFERVPLENNFQLEPGLLYTVKADVVSAGPQPSFYLLEYNHEKRIKSYEAPLSSGAFQLSFTTRKDYANLALAIRLTGEGTILLRHLRLKRLISKKRALSPSHREAKTCENFNPEDKSTPTLTCAKAPSAPPPAKDLPDASSKLRVAAIMDEFTWNSYVHACELIQLTPENGVNELEAFQPDILFVESAWRGKNDLWDRKIGTVSAELKSLIAWCREKSIPTIFWNKEDPVHFHTFMNTASHFDYVFTTDIDCIPHYKAVLGHERVFLLPFACQPKLQNPLEKYERKDGVCFAGAYYVRYPERQRDFDAFLNALTPRLPVEIYDRNFGKDDVNYQFPEQYKKFIIGNLPFEKIDLAYKGYKYAINMNSIKQSQTMFARRVYELLASNTLVLSNFSRGMRLIFGDLVISTDSGQELQRLLELLLKDNELYRKIRLAGLRKVLGEHTYQHRLNYILEKISHKPVQPILPDIMVVARVGTDMEVEKTFSNYSRQTYKSKHLVLVLDQGYIPESFPQGRDISVFSLSDARNIQPASHWSDKCLSMFSSQDYYGANYLTDLVLATMYEPECPITKAAWFEAKDDGQLVLQNSGQQYKSVEGYYFCRSLIHAHQFQHKNLLTLLKDLTSKAFEKGKALSIDEFNYCQDASSVNSLEVIDDLQDYNQGLPFESMLWEKSEHQPKPLPDTADLPLWDGSYLVTLFGNCSNESINIDHAPPKNMVLSSLLKENEHQYIYANKKFCIQDFVKEGKLRLYLDVMPGLNLSIVLIYYDTEWQRLGHEILPANTNNTFQPHEDTEWVQLGFRVHGPGCAHIRGLYLGHKPAICDRIISQSKHLLLTNQYPSYDDLYRNAFVHTRVRAYQARGVRVDVFRLQKDQPVSWHEFENVDVITGSQQALRRMLEHGQYKTVLVHFLSPDMWEVLKDFVDRVRVVVWVHGAEIYHWKRRSFNFETPEELKNAKLESDRRMHFWLHILNPVPENLHLVFVSRTFATEVMEDLELELPEDTYSIIHNPIDTDLFSYQEKDPEQRKKILSIRPFASMQYANDLSVKAILELSSKPFFKVLEFRIIGQGKLFDQTLAPLEKYDNVIIENRFLTQQEIADLHKEYGIFLCPTRWDSQGVSRDEAMASGLVPVTNKVAAVPEFVDKTTGMVADGEDYSQLAECVEFLFHNPGAFTSISSAACNNVNINRSAVMIIGKELAAFIGSSTFDVEFDF